jgi:hypothetical protein
MGNLGLCFISPAPQVLANLFLELARKTEEIGLSSFWINDRLVYDNFEPLAALAAAAACVARIAKLFEHGLGTLVVGLIIPDLNQVDLLGTNILPQLKGML